MSRQPMSRRSVLKLLGLGTTSALFMGALPELSNSGFRNGSVNEATQEATAAATVDLNSLVVKAVANLTKPNSQIRIGCSWGLVGHPYWDAVTVGTTAAQKAWGYDIRIGGPTVIDPRAQIAEVETWIAQKFDAIVYQALDAEGSVPMIKKAIDAGIPMITIDSDSQTSNRTVFDNQADDVEQAKAQFDQLASEMNGEGDWAFVVGEFTQAQKMAQLDWMKTYAAANYPKMKFTTVQECNDDETKAADIAQQLIVANPNLKGIISNSGAGLPGSAQGIKAAGKSGVVKVTGVAIPSLVKSFIKDGTLTRGFLWDPTHLGYRSIAIVDKLLHGTDITRATKLAVWDNTEEPADLRPNRQNAAVLDLILGKPLPIDKDNIDSFKF